MKSISLRYDSSRFIQLLQKYDKIKIAVKFVVLIENSYLNKLCELHKFAVGSKGSVLEYLD